MTMKNQRDFTGMRFYKLVAIRPTGALTKSRNRIWELACDCGGTRFADSGTLISGKAKSCGCFLRTNFICSVTGCGSKARCKGLCNTHYKRSNTNIRTSFNIHERFRMKSRQCSNGCIEWSGTCGSAGYGQTSIHGKKVSAHRLAWELANGPVPQGMFVCHVCDNRKCVNVEHLFLGTQSDNIKDAWAKGRGRAPWQCR